MMGSFPFRGVFFPCRCRAMLEILFKLMEVCAIMGSQVLYSIVGLDAKEEPTELYDVNTPIRIPLDQSAPLLVLFRASKPVNHTL